MWKRTTDPIGDRIFCRKTLCQTDILPTDILPIGHFTEKTFCRIDHLPKLVENLFFAFDMHTPNTISLFMPCIYMCTNFMKSIPNLKHSFYKLLALAWKYSIVFWERGKHFFVTKVNQRETSILGFLLPRNGVQKTVCGPSRSQSSLSAKRDSGPKAKHKHNLCKAVHGFTEKFECMILESNALEYIQIRIECACAVVLT